MNLHTVIREFSNDRLKGIIPFSAFGLPDNPRADFCPVSINTASGGHYRLEITSSYARPPLGHLKLVDHGTGLEIEGQIRDSTWHNIAQHLLEREAGYAPAPPVAAAPARPVIVQHDPFAVPMLPVVWYTADPGTWYQNGPALVTRAYSDGSFDLTIFPQNSEPFYRERVGRKSETLRNVCWEPYFGPQELMTAHASDEAAVAQDEVAQLAQDFANLSAQMIDLREEVEALRAQIPKRGRPPKHEAA